MTTPEPAETTPEHPGTTPEHADIAGYLLETLTPEERRRADDHLSGCADCRTEVDSLREWSDALVAVPEPMLLEGPPDGGDLLLQRTLRQVRSESGSQRRRRTGLISAAAALVAVAAIGGGILAGRSTAPETPLAQPSVTASVQPTTIPGTRTATTVDAATGTRMTVAVAPATGWVRVNAAVSGIPAGERCVLEVVAKDGYAAQAGSWLVSEAGETGGTTLNGSALVAPEDVKAVRVVNTTGKQFASVDI